jgi:hypothetical protein
MYNFHRALVANFYCRINKDHSTAFVKQKT